MRIRKTDIKITFTNILSDLAELLTQKNCYFRKDPPFSLLKQKYIFKHINLKFLYPANVRKLENKICNNKIEL